MADKPISGLPVVTTTNSTDLVTTVRPGDPAGTKNKQSTVGNFLKDFLPVKKVFSFVATAAQGSFTLPSTPPTPTLVTAFRNGVQARYGVSFNFTVSGNTLIWNLPILVTGEVISGFYNETGLSQLFNVITKSANDIAALQDASNVIEYVNGSSDFTYTLPQDSDIAFPIGSWIEIRKTGTGDITITKGTGAVFRGALGDVSVKIDGADGFSAFVEKTAADTWLLNGSVKAV